MRRLLYVLPLVLFGVVVAYFAIGLGLKPNEVPSALVGRPVPAFDLPALPGHARGLASADLRGEPALVNMFASWCIPCRAEHPVLMRLAEQEGITLYGINYKDKAEDALDWLRRYGNPYTAIGADTSGRAGIDWGISGVPETFVVDAEGVIRYQHIGPLTPRDVDTKILPLLKELRG